MNHNFNVTLAGKYGIEEAILIEHIYWWIHKNDCEEIEEMCHEGKVWCRSTAKGFAKYIPYMKPKKIWSILRKLEGKVLLIGNFNKNALNQTLWYTFTDDFKKELAGLDYDFPKMENAISKNEKSINTINSINIEDNIKESKKRISNDIPKNTRFVKPTVEDVEAYCKEKKYDLDAQYFIDYYDTRGWKLKGGVPVKDWKACIRTWMRKSKEKNNSECSASDEKPEELPAGLDATTWNKFRAWGEKEIPIIINDVSPDNYLTMLHYVCGQKYIMIALLKELNASGVGGNVLDRYLRLMDEPKYWEEIEKYREHE